MAKLSYEKDVKPLAELLQVDFNKKRDGKIQIDSSGAYWGLKLGGKDVYNGTLREVYCYLLGMQEFIK